MEIAPDDGSCFLGYEQGYGVNKTYWEQTHDNGTGGYRIFSGHGWNPTHWMPLPEAPIKTD